MKNKKGFTLIEIIVCIGLIAILGVGSTIAFISINNKKENDILESNSESFLNALNIYLATHDDVLDNIYNNVEGAVVSLELLKNDGLISDGLNIDYESNYFLLSDAVLVDNPAEGNDACNGRVSIQTIKSWDLSKYDSSQIIYVCPKDATTPGSTTISKFDSNTVFQGPNPNNWVKFDVIPENNDWIFFPKDEEEDLWRILRFTPNGEIKLIYNKSISRNSNNKPNGYSYGDEYYTSNSGMSLYEIIASIPDSNYNKTYNKNNNNYDYLDDTKFYPKYLIYQAITNKNWIKREQYYYEIVAPYTSYSSAVAEDYLGFENILYLSHLKGKGNKDYAGYTDYIGNININEVKATINDYDETYLNTQLFGYVILEDDGIFNEYSYRYVSIINNTTNEDTYHNVKNSYIVSYEYSSGYGTTNETKKKSIIYYYNPVITLKSNIKIKDYNNCSNGSIRGSKTCPFELIDTSL